MEEKRLALIQDFPRFIRKIAENKIAIELFESYKAAPYVQKIREFIKLPFYYASFLSQLVWTTTFKDGNHFSHLWSQKIVAFLIFQKLIKVF